MSFLKTERIVNGSGFSFINYYTCDITGEYINESQGWYGNDHIHISERGMEVLLEQWISRMSGVAPAALYYLTQRFTKKIKPDRYISNKMRNEVLMKYEHKCAICGSTNKLEIDHINPVSKGGLSEIKNLQVLCKSCNISKSNK